MKFRSGARRVSLDRRTVLAAQAGDEGSINAVLEACEGIVLHVARRQKPWSPTQTEDMAQQARIDVWVHALESWQPDAKNASGFKTWAAWWARSGASKEAKKERRLKDKERTETELWPESAEDGAGEDGASIPDEPLDVTSCCYRKFLGMVESRDREHREVQEVLFSCLRKLTFTEQRVLQLAFWEGKTVREIASFSEDPRWNMERMGKTKVVEVRNRALERLRGMLVAKEFETWL